MALADTIRIRANQVAEDKQLSLNSIRVALLKTVAMVLCWSALLAAIPTQAQTKGRLRGGIGSTIYADLSDGGYIRFHEALLAHRSLKQEYDLLVSRWEDDKRNALDAAMDKKAEAVGELVAKKKVELDSASEKLEAARLSMKAVIVPPNTLCFLLAKKTIKPLEGDYLSDKATFYKVKIISGQFKGKIAWTQQYADLRPLAGETAYTSGAQLGAFRLADYELLNETESNGDRHTADLLFGAQRFVMIPSDAEGRVSEVDKRGYALFSILSGSDLFSVWVSREVITTLKPKKVSTSAVKRLRHYPKNFLILPIYAPLDLD